MTQNNIAGVVLKLPLSISKITSTSSGGLGMMVSESTTAMKTAVIIAQPRGSLWLISWNALEGDANT